MATMTTHSSEKPCCTKTAGPSRNSPLPIEAPRTITPGPTVRSHCKPRGRGGSGSSARRHESRPERDSTEINSRLKNQDSKKEGQRETEEKVPQFFPFAFF